jgi:glutathione peroxidase
MNELADKFGDKLVILAFPCNQFGHQENGDGDEILHNLKHVRPGKGYEPKLVLMEKCIVNGEGTHPVFEWLKQTMPAPHDDPDSLMANPQFIMWSPVKRSDISWNFEKFLISPAGAPVKRYSRYFITSKIATDIEHLMKA